MRRVVTVVAVLMFMGGGASLLAQFPRIKPNPLTIQKLPFVWPTTPAEADQVSVGQVLNLLNQIDRVLAGSTDSVEDYTFAKLDGKSFYLIALPDSGRGSSGIAVIQCRENSCTYDYARSAPPNDLAREIVGIEGDGRYEIVTKELVVGYFPARTKEIFTYYIYAVRTDGSLMEVSSRYPAFFEQQILPKMKATEQEMQSLFPGADAESDEVHAELIYADRDYERRIRGISTAGLTEAKQWQSSLDEDIQVLAAKTFEAIDSPDAEAALKLMSQSTNRLVSGAAQGALARKASHFNIHGQ